MYSQLEKPLLKRNISPQIQKIEDDSTSSEEWGSSCSSNSSLSDEESTDSYIPDWNPYIQDNGSLFYIEYNNHSDNHTIHSKQSIPENSLNAARNAFNRVSTRRSKAYNSKLSKLMSRHLKFRHSSNTTNNKDEPINRKSPITMNTATTTNTATPEITKVKFSEISKGEIKKIHVYIDPSMRNKFGRRASVCESILGVSVSPFPDGQRIMIAGYMPNSYLSQEKIIKVGDWLKAINDQEVTAENVDLLLLSFMEPVQVELTLQRMSGEEPMQSDQHLTNKIISLSDFVTHAKHVFNSDLAENGLFNVLYVTMDGFDEQNVSLYYPEKSQNCVFKARGSFLTLHSLLMATFNSVTVSTTIRLGNVDLNVLYRNFGEDILLFAISSNYLSLHETSLKLDEMLRTMELLHRTIPVAIMHNCNDLFSMTSITLCHNSIRHSATTKNVSFENALLESHYVPLPKEAQLRIDEALNEMEAMDYREWNDEPLKSHREFYIIGSVLYYKHYMLASHLPIGDLLDVESFLRTHGIIKLLETTKVRELVIWQQIYPNSVERGLVEKNGIYGIPKGDWFLAIVARNNMLLAAILESRYNSAISCSNNDNDFENGFVTPSPFYIEEIQDTLEHLRTVGIENLANTWVLYNKRPQIIKENLEHHESTSTNPGNTIQSTKKPEIISILKRRNNSSENVGSGPMSALNTSLSESNSQTMSEDSSQKYEDDDDSDSDWDGCPNSLRSSSGFDMSDITESVLKEVSDVIPSKITTGPDNVLFHYVQIEVGEGILLAPTNISSNSIVIGHFRKTCLLIHKILQNTMRFRFLLSQESSKPNSHKSLVAIKEHGVLFSINSNTNNDSPLEFWVIGRLFAMPTKELYVCHRADVPQNMVELAFRLAMNSSG